MSQWFLIALLLGVMLFTGNQALRADPGSNSCCCTSDCTSYCLENGSCSPPMSACNGGAVGPTNAPLNLCCSSVWGLCNVGLGT